MTNLQRLAEACTNGACNVRGLINAMPEAIRDIPLSESIRDNVELKVIVGQISYLIGESLGPTFEALAAYDTKAAQRTKAI